MFHNLMMRNVSLIFLRLQMMIYIHQRCYVKWIQARSYSFGVTNGTRQGAVFSPKGGFSTYLDDLVGDLRKSGLGLRSGLHWYGALLWADDCILLSTSVHDLQKMVDMCQKHAQESDLVFSTDPKDPKKSKTMCIAFNSTVKNLHLSRKGIEDKEGQDLARMLLTNKTLRKLELESNILGL